VFAAVLIAWVADYAVREPLSREPLTGLRARLEALGARLDGSSGDRDRGALALAAIVGLAGLLGQGLAQVPVLGWLLTVLLLFGLLGMRTLRHNARAVLRPLAAGEPSLAAQRVAGLAGVSALPASEADLVRHTVAWLLELSITAVFGVLFWCVVLGLPGLAAYGSLALCASAWPPAVAAPAQRLLGLLNWPVSRLAALGLAVAGDAGPALRVWRRGLGGDEVALLVSTAGAALRRPLADPGTHGAGAEAALDFRAIEAVLALLQRAVLVWLVVLFLVVLVT
jgi:adenosylcobinamide-phosphate synthase